MKTTQLLEGLVFNAENPHAVALYVDKNGRAIRWTLEPQQSIKTHEVPQSPFFVVILEGHGWFSGADGKEARVEPDALLVFEPGEPHHIRAEEERLVFVGFLWGAPGNASAKVGGEIGRGAS